MYFYQFDRLFEKLPVFTSNPVSITVSVINILAYVFTALALHTMAKRRCINNPWLAWIPVANLWVLGSLSDQYRYVVKGELHAKRRLLLVLEIISLAIKCVMAILTLFMIFGFIDKMLITPSFEALFSILAGPGMGLLTAGLTLLGVKIAKSVIRYMALYDIYSSSDPQDNVLFLVLSILISVTEPFFVFFNRNKDLGMPPRREEPAAQQPWQPTAPIDEPWANNGPDYL